MARSLGAEQTHIQTRYGRLLDGLVRSGDRWLDIGCGRQIIPAWALPPADVRRIVDRAGNIVGIDFDAAILEHPDLDERVIASGYDLPFSPETFDVISANMVMEHIGEPGRFLSQVARVLKPGGRFVCATPNARSPMIQIAARTPDGIKKRLVWFLENRKAEDVFPTHYRFNDESSVRKYAAKSGLMLREFLLVNTVTSFSKLGPVGIAEVVFHHYVPAHRRTNILCVLEKPALSNGA